MTRSARIRARREARSPRFTVRDGARLGAGIAVALLALVGFGVICVACLGGGLLAVLG